MIENYNYKNEFGTYMALSRLVDDLINNFYESDSLLSRYLKKTKTYVLYLRRMGVVRRDDYRNQDNNFAFMVEKAPIKDRGKIIIKDFHSYYHVISLMVEDINNMRGWNNLNAYFREHIKPAGPEAIKEPITFLSYAFKDNIYALFLYDYFEMNHGFLYVDSLFGEDYKEDGRKIKAALSPWINASSQILFLHSIHSDKGAKGLSSWCSWELGEAYRNNNHENRFFKVVVAGVNQTHAIIDREFREMDYVDYTGYIVAKSSAYKLEPVVKSYIWGGNYFKKFGKGIHAENISELWELSARNDSSRIVSGKLRGQLLKDVLEEEDVGPVSKKFPYFPLLIKLIDAKENLSVQVHPSDDYALKNEKSFGKTEMWHILSHDEGAGLYVGLNRDYSKEEIEEKLKNGIILDALNFFPVKDGDTFLINSGTIHAIGKGVRLIEIQQNSDLTYRLYDYHRKGADGKERELHIDKALKVIDYHAFKKSVSKGNLLEDTRYFKVERVEIHGELFLKADKDSFISFTFIDGNGSVDNIPYNIYDTFFLPYGRGCNIKGEGTIIVSYL